MKKFLAYSLLFICIQAQAHTVVSVEGKLPEVTIGSDKAPLKLVVYTSLTCGYCSMFHTGVLPHLIKNYTRKGKLFIQVKDFPIDNIALQASMFAWSSGKANYLKNVSLIYEHQEKWLLAKNPLKALLRLKGLKAVKTKQKIKEALTDKKLRSAIFAQVYESVNKDQVDGTPTFIFQYELNGKHFHEMFNPKDLKTEYFEQAINAQLRKLGA